MNDPPYHLDIHGLAEAEENRTAEDVGKLRARPWVGIRFDCCGLYARIYRNAQGTAYHGYCPHCRRTLTLRVGPGGTDARLFTAQ